MDKLEFTKHIAEVHDRLIKIAHEQNIPLFLSAEVGDNGGSYTSVHTNLDPDSIATAVGNVTRFVIKKAIS